ncbi:MAG: FxsA family protein [Gemmatimonadota bacterium]
MNVLGRLFVLFVLVPVLELALLIQLGRVLGLLPTVGLVLLTGALGAWLARAEGVRVFFRFQSELASGRLPHQSLFDGICVLVGGALLLTPGVLTDLVGFALLLPPSRRWLQKRMRRSLESRIQEGSIRVVTFGAGSGFGGFAGTEGPPSGEPEAGPEELDGLDPRHGIEVPRDER